MLPGIIRWSAAEGSACKSFVCDKETVITDPKMTEELYQLVEKLNREDKITVIMISHDLPSTIRYASHILRLGSEIFYGTKQEYVERYGGGKDGKQCKS